MHMPKLPLVRERGIHDIFEVKNSQDHTKMCYSKMRTQNKISNKYRHRKKEYEGGPTNAMSRRLIQYKAFPISLRS